MTWLAAELTHAKASYPVCVILLSVASRAK
jgi:hypothetical protein